jgi:hypothetical protein
MYVIYAMAAAKLINQCPQAGNASPTSTPRVARWRARKKRGVLFVAGLEVLARDLQVLKRCGCLKSDDPEVVGKDEFETGLWSLLDGLARRLGVLGAAVEEPPTKSDV